MTGRRNNPSIVANPVLVGAVTTLIVVVAVFLAYNANNGLPFVPTRALNVQLANGANLVPGNEVRSGGYRVGVVEDMKPISLPNGRVGALLKLKLDDRVGEIPTDSTVVVRPRSALGLKYVELHIGKEGRKLPDGGTLPLAQTRASTELDEVFSTFDAKTRQANQDNLQGFGDAFSGRGAGINETLRVAPALVLSLKNVMTNLNDPRTRLPRFFAELGDAARIVAPVSKQNAETFTFLANTFDAIGRDPEALKATISKNVDTLEVGTRSLAVQRPFLGRFTRLSRNLNGVSRELRASLPTINRAVEVATPVLARSVTLNDQLQDTMDALRGLAVAPTTNGALRGLTATVTSLNPTLRFLGPYVTVCNSWNSFWTFAAEHLSAPTNTGSQQRAMLNTAPENFPGGDGVTQIGANEFAHGKESPEPGSVKTRLHNALFGPAITKDGKANCGAGQQGYAQSHNPYRDRTLPGDPYRDVFVETPNVDNVPRVGSTFKKYDKNGKGIGRNRDEVPAGQTFSYRPEGRGVDVPRLPPEKASGVPEP
ncbi:MlaD family protein [Paraconexibacter sp.]|uniref:MlaD family protein n=1 Tax=Paraconexibacter sp. TaxID=2949640 RepID=UPI003564F1FD